MARTLDRRPLRFSIRGDDVERAYRTHWLSPELTRKESEKIEERQGRPPDLVVIQPLKDVRCSGCDSFLDMLIMDDAGPLCLSCAGMGHLVFVPAVMPT